MFLLVLYFIHNTSRYPRACPWHFLKPLHLNPLPLWGRGKFEGATTWVNLHFHLSSIRRLFILRRILRRTRTAKDGHPRANGRRAWYPALWVIRSFNSSMLRLKHYQKLSTKPYDACWQVFSFFTQVISLLPPV